MGKGYEELTKPGEGMLDERALAEELRNSISERYSISGPKDWIELVRPVEITSSVARFLLLVGSNNRDVDDNLKIKKLRDPKHHRTIAEDAFSHEAYETIEHIIPVTEQGKNQSGLPAYLKNQLWNLTLLPRNVNSSLSNDPWPIKQKQYAVFSSEDEDEYERNLEELKKTLGREPSLYKEGGPKYGFSLKTKYLAMLKTTKYTQEEGQEITDQILMFCWEKLAEEWLEWASQP